MSQKQLQRVKVIENAVQGRITVRQAAALLALSERQVQRLKKSYEAASVDWVHHGNRGRAPAHRVAESVRRTVVKLARSRHSGFNDTHLHEKLTTAERLSLSRQSVRRILRKAGLASPQKRRPRKYRSRRERRPQEGLMLQADASRHDWLQGRGPMLTLVGFIDDATSRVPAAGFQLEHEDTAGYLRVSRRLTESRGIPCSIYRDQHSTFQRNDEHWSLEEQLAGRQDPTQLGRCWEELGITSIAALSAQAKGRIERLWRTFQDRLQSELRLAGACTLEQANAALERFLPEYNQKFGQPAAQPGSAYRTLDRRLDLDYIFAFRFRRTVNPDHTIAALPGVSLQLPPIAGRQGYAGKQVDVCQQPNGDLKIYLDRRLLLEHPAPLGASAPRAPKSNRRKGPRKKKPARIYVYAGRPFVTWR